MILKLRNGLLFAVLSIAFLGMVFAPPPVSAADPNTEILAIESDAENGLPISALVFFSEEEIFASVALDGLDPNDGNGNPPGLSVAERAFWQDVFDGESGWRNTNIENTASQTVFYAKIDETILSGTPPHTLSAKPTCAECSRPILRALWFPAAKSSADALVLARWEVTSHVANSVPLAVSRL